MVKKEQPKRNQRPTSYRLSPEALALIEALGDKLGISRAAVLEMAIRHLARREKVKAALVEYLDRNEGKQARKGGEK